MQVNKPLLLISILGPTAVGKTALGIKLAALFHTEIISADSRQFYRELEIGTAKPNEKELAQVRHHFINSHSIAEMYNAGMFERDAGTLIAEMSKTHTSMIAVGGSMLYLKALWEGFDEMPKIAEGVREKLNIEAVERGLNRLLAELKEADPTYFDEVDRNNRHRVVRALEVIRSSGKPFSSFRIANRKEKPYRNLKIGLVLDREVLYKRIDSRMDQMIEKGLFEEATSLIPFKGHSALQTVGYSEVFDFLSGKYDKEEAIRLLKRNSRRYAKRQLTWLNKYQDIHWFQPEDEKEIVSLIKREL